jgi:hypothetical protein
VQSPAAPAGPAPISPLHHPRPRWGAWGNGSPVTLEACDKALQGQQWTFTGDVLMNGSGYCLQPGQRVVARPPAASTAAAACGLPGAGGPPGQFRPGGRRPGR